MNKRFDFRKAAIYSIVINGLQIIAMLALAILVLFDRMNDALQGPMGDILIVALVALVSWGALVDIREAVRAIIMRAKLSGLDETVTQMTDLNKALRAQRHDFLNHLQVVYSLIEMAEYDEANRYITQVYGDIQQLSRTMKTACAPVNALLRAKLGEAKERGIQVELSVLATWNPLPLPDWEMCRVLSNLIDNAMDAMAQQKNGRLSLRLAENVNRYSFSVENNGPMIPPALQERIFEAGFSVKGEGRGMGLPIARETLRAFGGDLTVTSDAEATIFSGFVPRTRPSA